MGRDRLQRQAWTDYVQCADKLSVKPNKYGAERKNGYASKREADEAAKLAILASRGVIHELREQVSFTLVEGNGKIRPIRYVADFTWKEDGLLVVADAKGYDKNQVYRLKKKLMKLLLGIDIREL